MIQLKEVSKDIYDVSDWMDRQFGAVGSPEREKFRIEAEAYCVGQIIRDARKEEKITQTELAKRVGSSKSYISRIEHGTVEPGAGLFLRILDALGLRLNILKPVL
jgi:ribosome-binding protein aMBF1 (putative translation factor)